MAPNTPASEPLRSEELTGGRDPFDQFEAWFDDAKKSELNDPNAMAVATVDDHGMPNVRMVLLKGLDGPAAANRGFVFYTNFEGTKGRELLANPMAGLLFHWKSLERQVRVRGHVSVVTDAEADDYYASRPRLSRIGAWASQQSRPLEGRFALESAVATYTAKFGVGAIPRPPYWSGLRVTPVEMEFWISRPFRLHDRIVYKRANSESPWTSARLFP